MRNKKIILSSALSLVLCLSLIVGGTFALFTSESQVNIAITSGTVKIETEITDWEIHSLSDIDRNTFEGELVDRTKEGTFITGGTAAYENGEVTLVNMVPGDGVSFNIAVTNNSNVAIQYRTVISAVSVNNADGSTANLIDVLKITIRNQAYIGAAAEKWQSTSETGVIDNIPVAIDLPAEVGNEWMDKTITLAVKVEAVQGNAAVYDDAVISNNTDLAATIADVENPTVIMMTPGTYNLPNNKTMQNKDITFAGSKDTVIDLNTMKTGQNTSGSTFTFDGVTVQFDAKANYSGLQHTAKMVYKNCTIIGQQTLYAPEAEFINCVFTTNEAGYNVWTYGAEKVTFTDCTFYTAGRAILVYNEMTTDSFVADITMNNCTFYDNGVYTDAKAAVETGTNGGNTETSNVYKLTFNNCTVNGFEANKSTSPAWGNKNDMDADHLIVVENNVTINEITTIPADKTLGDVVAEATEKTTVALPGGTVELPALTNKDITFVGTKDTVIDTTTALPSTNNANLTFEGVTVKFAEANYKGFTHSEKVVYKDCIIEGQQTLYAPEAEFINCTFVNQTGYNVWTYGAKKVTFTDCTFTTGGRAILVYNETTNASFEATITMNNCSFSDDGTYQDAKAAVETGTNGGNTETSNVYNLVFNGCTISGFEANNSTSPLWGNKNSMDDAHLNVTIDDKVVY